MRYLPYLLLFALVVRALVPLGYMPDAGALRDGRIEVAFCTAGGVAAVPASMGLPAAGELDDSQLAGGVDCAFSLLSHQALAVPAPAAGTALRIAVPAFSTPVFDDPALPALGAQGPPLGSRAPPALLA